MTEEMPPGRGFGAGGSGDDPLPSIIRAWQRQRDAQWRTAVEANRLMNRTPPSPPPPYYRELLSLASALIADGHYQFRHELVVIVAQMACEVVVEQTLTPLLKKKRRKPPRTFDLQGGALTAYLDLTHDRLIKRQPFWKPFDLLPN